jgi:hypothetical protein
MKRELNWNVYAGAILLLIVFFQAMQWPLSPKFLDIYYHLSVMKGFADAGGFVTTAFWEYAPGGRPHLYPPFLHILMLAFYKVGLSPMDVGRLVDVSSYPLLLTTFWIVAKKICSEKIAFIALVLLVSIYSLLLASTTLSAFNLAAIGLLWMALKLHQRRFVQAALLLGLIFYTHTLYAWLSALFIFLYSLRRSSDRSGCIRTLFLGALLGAPFIIYQFQFRDHFTLVSNQLNESHLLEIDIALYALVILGLWYCRKKEFTRKAWIPLCLWLAATPLLATHHVRFVFGHGLLGAVLLSAIALDKLTAKSGKILAGVLVLITFVSPVFHWNFKDKQGGLRWADRTLMRYMLPDPYMLSRASGFTIYFQEPYEEMKRVIQANSKRGDIIWTDFSYTAGILAVLSDRSTSCAMLAEIKPYQESQRIKDAKTIIWFKNKELRARDGMVQAVLKYDLRLLKEVEMAYIFDNPNYSVKPLIPKALISSVALFAIIGVIFAALMFPAKKNS